MIYPGESRSELAVNMYLGISRGTKLKFDEGMVQ
jgi:hypothetical protein